jgi:hypothetical protein
MTKFWLETEKKLNGNGKEKSKKYLLKRKKIRMENGKILVLIIEIVEYF